jgi:hypothetical protein
MGEAKEAIHIIYHIARRIWADAELGIVCITITELVVTGQAKLPTRVNLTLSS